MNNKKARALMARTYETFNLIHQQWVYSLEEALASSKDNSGHRSTKTTVIILVQCPWTGTWHKRYRTK